MVCRQDGVIRIIIIIVFDRYQVMFVVRMLVVWCLCSMVLSGSLLDFLWCVVSLWNIGVFFRQWCRQIEISLNMLFRMKGMCQVQFVILVGVQMLLMKIFISEFSRMLLVMLVVSELMLKLQWLVGMCLVMKIQVLGILLLMVVFCRVCINSSRMGVVMLMLVQVGNRLMISVGIVIRKMDSVNMCLWLIMLLQWVMMMLFIGCVR